MNINIIFFYEIKGLSKKIIYEINPTPINDNYIYSDINFFNLINKNINFFPLLHH